MTARPGCIASTRTWPRADVALGTDEVSQIDEAASRVTIEVARYPDELEARTGR